MNKPLLRITVSALMLAGCAADYDKAAYRGCNGLAGPDHQARWEMVAPGIMSLGMDMPTKKRLGLANSNEVAAKGAACAPGDNKIRELQKIGRLHAPASSSGLITLTRHEA